MGILKAISDIGLLRDINEDYVFCSSHPKDQNIKLLVVADGMGGKSQGDIASQETVANIEAWFYHEDFTSLKTLENLDLCLDNRVKSLNKYLIEKYGRDVLGTTLTVAVVSYTKTLIYNVGDSRAYVYNGKELTQITEDDSGVWIYYKDGDVSKDDLRFFPTNNFITACVGLNEDFCKSKYYVIPNDYEILLLLSDGVTDLLSDSDIKKELNKKEKEDILQNIINKAINKDLVVKVPTSFKRKFKDKFTVPLHGRDNASGVIYIKD